MTWAAVALAGAALAAFINIIDKRIIVGYARTPKTQPLAIGLTMPLVGAVLLAASGVPDAAGVEPVVWALVSGALYGLGAQILLFVLYTQEVSRAVPVFQTYPLFTAVIAFVVLGERFGPTAWLAILAIVAGAALLSMPSLPLRGIFRRGEEQGSGGRGLPPWAFLLLIVGSALEGSSYVFGKSAVDELPVLTTHALRMFALSGVLLAFNLRRRPLADLRLFVRRRSPALIYIALNQFVVANLGLLMFMWALSLGPAALVTALTSLRTFFLVVFTIALSLVWRGSLGERPTPGAVPVKLGATALIVAGAATIALGGG